MAIRNQKISKKAFKPLLSRVSKRIIPSVSETRKHIETVNKAMELAANTVPNNIEVVLTGSSAKGTSMAGSTDIDIFLLFPLTYPKHELSYLGLEYAKRAFKGKKTEIGYANHPYLRAWLDDYKIDIVPSYKIGNASELTSAVDRSPLHTKYVNSHLSQTQKNDVRLLKAFAKALGVYGAEARVEGFSGYLCELLIIKYGSFIGALAAASDWKNPVIDIENHHNERAHEKFPNSPMIVIDPVDLNRNVSAVVSTTSLYRLAYAARKFLQNPSEKFFFAAKSVTSPSKLRGIIKSRNTTLIAIELASPSIVNDILWPQLKKTTMALYGHLEQNGFAPFGHYFYSDNKTCLILIECKFKELPNIRKVSGPAVHLKSACDDFVQKHKGSYDLHIEHDRIVSLERAIYTDIWGAVDDFMAHPQKHGVPSNFSNIVGKYQKVDINKLLSQKYLFVASDYFTRKL